MLGFSDMDDASRYLWAKSDEGAGHGLLAHLLDVAAVALTVLEHEPRSSRRWAAEALGLVFVANPVIGGQITMDNVTAQGAAIAASAGPVFAYCASGNRSSIVWALANSGKRPVDELVGLPARFGYQLDHLRPQIEALAKG